jgi:hypothetical protein
MVTFALKSKSRLGTLTWSWIADSFNHTSILLPNSPLLIAGENPIFVIDWEMAQLGSRALDLAEMIGELYCYFLFKGIGESKQLLEGFVAGYGHIKDDVAFRTALQVGVHLISFASRVPGLGTHEQVEHAVALGRDLVVRAWQKDRSWLEKGDFACLFKTGSDA